MDPTPAEVLALLIRVLHHKGILTAEEVDYITMWSPDWEGKVYERDHDSMEIIK